MSFCPACGNRAVQPVVASREKPITAGPLDQAASASVAASMAPPAPEPPRSHAASAEPEIAASTLPERVQRTASSPRSLRWKISAFTAVGAAGGYVVWAMFFDATNRENHYGWDTWILTLITVGLLVLFVVSGLEDFEHRLRHGRWTAQHYHSVRLANVVLKGQTVSVVVAVTVHLYLSLVLHRPLVAVSWGVQFAIFASVVYAWLQSIGSGDGQAARVGARTGWRWGFWSALISAHLSILILCLTEGLPHPVLAQAMQLVASPDSGPLSSASFVALVLGIAVTFFTLVGAGLAAVSMAVCGYVGGRAIEAFPTHSLKRRLAAGLLALCACNLVLAILSSFVLDMSPLTKTFAQPYDGSLVQFLIVSVGSLIGIALAPPVAGFATTVPHGALD